ncbi:hypothetical protein VNI00_005283 [Paramarasmius palmivorus]|uniref:RING-type domain-containing protein n=1 Tax=Paramarasmius palmivorus TaxID=297713 RepID=A0AAW0DGG9_9AGAR
MLCLASGSVCDVCLDTFGTGDKAPCAIECGHVFCVDCKDHFSPPACPFCRKDFDPHYVSKLHVEFDPRITEEKEIRPWLERIAKFAKEGSDEATLRLLIEECYAFLDGRPRTRPTKDLHVIIGLIKYLYETKSKLRAQKKTEATLREDLEKTHIEAARIHADLNLVRGQNVTLEEKLKESEDTRRNELDRFTQTEVQLRRQLSESQADHIDLLKKVNELEVVREQLRQVYVPIVAPPKEKLDGFAPHPQVVHNRPSVDNDDLEMIGGSLTEDGAFFSPLPDIGLQDPDRFFGPQPMDTLTIHTPPTIELSSPPADGTPARTPSMLSMTAPSNSHIPSRPLSPSGHHAMDDQSSSHREPFPVQYGPHPPEGLESVVYRPTGAEHLRNRFLEIMRDESPVSSSMPNLPSDHHFPSYVTGKDKPSSSTSTNSSRPVKPSRSPEPSSFGQPSTPPPMPLPPVKATAAITPSSSYSQASLVAAALEEKKRQQRKIQEHAHDGERRRKDSDKTKDYKDGSRTPAGSPPLRFIEPRGNDAVRDLDRPELTRSSSRKHSSSSSTNVPQITHTSSSTTHSYQDGGSKKSYEGWSNSVRSSSSSAQQLKAAPTVASTAPRDPLPSYRSSYSSSMGQSKGKVAASMLSNQASVSVA